MGTTMRPCILHKGMAGVATTGLQLVLIFKSRQLKTTNLTFFRWHKFPERSFRDATLTLQRLHINGYRSSGGVLWSLETVKVQPTSIFAPTEVWGQYVRLWLYLDERHLATATDTLAHILSTCLFGLKATISGCVNNLLLLNVNRICMAFKLYRLWAGKGHLIAFLGPYRETWFKKNWKKSLKPFLAFINYSKCLAEGQHSTEGLLSRPFSSSVNTLPSRFARSIFYSFPASFKSLLLFPIFF